MENNENTRDQENTPVRRPRLHIAPTPGFQPSVPQGTLPGKLVIRARLNHHTIERRKQSSGNLTLKVETPRFCPVCHSDRGQIEELLRDGQWWWHCKGCDHQWDPIKNTD